MIDILPYDDTYKAGVLAVLRRNCPWLAHIKDDESLYETIKPMLSYHWCDDVTLLDAPFKYGAILVDNGNNCNVVGFLGTIYSYRHIEGRKLLFMAGTTWCIDTEYRAHVFKVSSEIYNSADIILDLTPNTASLEIDTKLFGFHYFNDKLFVFKTVPTLRNKVNVKFFHDSSEIPNYEHQKNFKDHEQRNIRYASFERNGETGSLFYIRRYIWKFGRIVWKNIRIVSVSNKKLFTQNLREILWKIQKHEKFLVTIELDSHFTDGKFHHPLFKTMHVDRLMFSREKLNIEPDFLYSELSIF